MKEILLLSPFCLQGTYVHENLQKKQVLESKFMISDSVSSNFFNEKRLDNYIDLKNELSKSYYLYFVLTNQVNYKDFQSYLINLAKAIHKCQPRMIVLDYITCNTAKNKLNDPIIQVLESIFYENEFPVISLKKGSHGFPVLEYSRISEQCIEREFILETQQHVKGIFEFKNQLNSKIKLTKSSVLNTNYKYRSNFNKHNYTLN